MGICIVAIQHSLERCVGGHRSGFPFPLILFIELIEARIKTKGHGRPKGNGSHDR